jgi:hypothetical protein
MPRWILPALDFAAGWAVLTAVLLASGARIQVGALLAALMLVALNWAGGLYAGEATGRQRSSLDRKRTTALLSSTALFSWLAWLLSGTLLGSGELHHVEGLAVWLWTFGACLLNRSVSDLVEGYGARPERWLVVGDVETAARLDRILGDHGTARAAGSVPLPPQGPGLLGLREDALALVEHFRADRVILAPRVAERETMLKLINTFKAVGVQVSLLPQPVELAGTSALASKEISGVPVIDVGPLTIGKGVELRDNSANGNAIESHRRAPNGNGHRNGNGSHAAGIRNGLNGSDRGWPRVSVVVPAMNESRNLPYVFARLPEGLHEVILVDGNSTDDTVAVARQVRPDIRVVAQSGRGKGDALRTGFASVTGDIIVTLDADGSADPAEIPRFVDHLLAGADFAKGSRFVDGGGSADITTLRRLGNWGLSRAANVFHGARYTDLCYGYNAFWTHCLPCISLDMPGFEVETLMNLRVGSAGLKVAEVPSFEAERIHGQSNLNTFRDGGRVLRTIIKEWVRTQGNSAAVGEQTGIVVDHSASN